MIEPDETALAALLAAVLHELVQPTAAAQLLVSQAAEQLERAKRSLRRAALNTDVLRWLVMVLRGDAAAAAMLSARSVVATLEGVALSQVRLAVDMPAHLSLLAAPGALEMVLGNLLANARKYAGGALVSVHATRADADEVPWPQGSPYTLRDRVVLLTVADDGPGVAADVCLFEPFSAASSGSGIGLWLCRRIVRAHGGDLWRAQTQHGAAFTSAWKEAPSPLSSRWPSDLEKLGKAMRAERVALHLTRPKLAALAGVADSTIRNIEFNKHQPTEITLRALTDALDKAAGQAGVPQPNPVDKKGRIS